MFTKELSEIRFSLASSDEIRARSVFEANISKYGNNKQNTVYDPRSGAVNNFKCATCKEYEQKCPGHFGHIELNTSIVFPIYFRDVFNILKLICYNCKQFVLTKKHLKFSNILNLEGDRRINEMIEKVKKFSKCFHCDAPIRKYKIRKDPYLNIIDYEQGNQDIEITDEEIKNIFDDIHEETVELLKMSHPKNFIIDVFPVIPLCCRPSDYVNNNIKEDEFTKLLGEIIKVTNQIKLYDSKDYNGKKNLINSLKLKIESFCRTPKKKAKCISTEPIKGIRERLTGKDGQLRENLMGKRTEMSGRTVIGPAPDLNVDEIGIPQAMADNLTTNVIVTSQNYDSVIAMIKNNIIKKVKRNDRIIHLDYQRYKNIIKLLKEGDIIVRNNKKIVVDDIIFNLQNNDKIFRDGKDITPNKMPTVVEPEIFMGDIAQKKLQNGDVVLINRQPTLLKQSMQAHKVRIGPFKTMRLNTSMCNGYNADFDGDEMNLHIPQSDESIVELTMLNTPENNILSSSNSNPVIKIIQDSLLGAYLMTTDNDFYVNECQYNDIIMLLHKSVNYYLDRREYIRNHKGDRFVYSGLGLFSLIFPPDFMYHTETVTIKRGIVEKALFTKEELGSTKNSFIFLMTTEYGGERCLRFVDDVNFMTNKWLTYRSFTVNIDDCKTNDKVNEIVQEKLNESEYYSTVLLNERLLEAKINITLSAAKDIGMKMSTDSSNNFATTIKAGSKGDFFNLGQVKGLLGQQIINGKRIAKTVDNNTRSLIHYPRTNLSVSEKYECRGFISNGFYEGLNPKEFFFHSMSGRQGVCDTAMTTFRSGYSMRKIIKNTEDIKIQSDGSVVDSLGTVYSYSYGETGVNPENHPGNYARIIDMLNALHM